jgi:hypothetical protein
LDFAKEEFVVGEQFVQDHHPVKHFVLALLSRIFRRTSLGGLILNDSYDKLLLKRTRDPSLKKKSN